MSLTSINIYTLKQVRASRRHYEVENCKITCPLACYNAIQDSYDLKSAASEVFGIISLNTKNKLAGLHIIAIGSLDSAYIEPREVFKAAMLNNANAIIAFHNHPSGDPEPSPVDVVITRRLKEAGELLGIKVLDHIVTGEKGYVSLKERKLF